MYFTLQRTGYPAALQVMQLAVNRTIQLYTTPAVLHITSHYTGRSFTGTQIKQIILTLLNDVEIIDCDHATALIAVNSKISDVEDALQYYTALRHGIDYFISADKNLKKASIPQLPVYTAAELLAELEAP